MNAYDSCWQQQQNSKTNKYGTKAIFLIISCLFFFDGDHVLDAMNALDNILLRCWMKDQQCSIIECDCKPINHITSAINFLGCFFSCFEFHLEIKDGNS